MSHSLIGDGTSFEAFNGGGEDGLLSVNGGGGGGGSLAIISTPPPTDVIPVAAVIPDPPPIILDEPAVKILLPPVIVEPIVLGPPPVEEGVFVPGGVLTRCAPGFVLINRGTRSERCVPSPRLGTPEEIAIAKRTFARTSLFIDRNRDGIDDRDQVVSVSSVGADQIPQRNLTMVALVGAAAVALFLALRKR